jgi:hypothetical protein
MVGFGAGFRMARSGVLTLVAAGHADRWFARAVGVTTTVVGAWQVLSSG